MKTTNNTKPLWANAEQMENLRKALRKRLSHEELDNSWRLDALTALLQVDPVTLHVCWIQPLLAEGVSMEVAITCVAESYLLPN
jgi:hypothetical protein